MKWKRLDHPSIASHRCLGAYYYYYYYYSYFYKEKYPQYPKYPKRVKNLRIFRLYWDGLSEAFWGFGVLSSFSPDGVAGCVPVVAAVACVGCGGSASVRSRINAKESATAFACARRTFSG
jgi:hypothetical protein